MSDVVPSTGHEVRALTVSRPLDRRSNRALSVMERDTVVRAASVHARAIVQTEKLHEIDRLAREAMAGQAMLNQWASTLAHGDPFVADELKFFTDVARLGKGEVIADTVASFGREVG